MDSDEKINRRRASLEDTVTIKNMLIIVERGNLRKKYDYENMEFGDVIGENTGTIIHEIRVSHIKENGRPSNYKEKYNLKCICLEVGVHGTLDSINNYLEYENTFGECANDLQNVQYIHYQSVYDDISKYVYSFVIMTHFEETFDVHIRPMNNNDIYEDFIPICLTTLVDFLKDFKSGTIQLYCCDIKPGNFVIRYDVDGDPTLNIIDFAPEYCFNENGDIDLSENDKKAFNLLMVLQFLIILKKDYVTNFSGRRLDYFEIRTGTGNPPSDEDLKLIWGPDGFFNRDTFFHKRVKDNFIRHLKYAYPGIDLNNPLYYGLDIYKMPILTYLGFNV